jgi:guanyl-specific ribonuclease Sa
MGEIKVQRMPLEGPIRPEPAKFPSYSPAVRHWARCVFICRWISISLVLMIQLLIRRLMLPARSLHCLVLAALLVVSCGKEEPNGREALAGPGSSERSRHLQAREEIPLKAVRVYEHVLLTGRAPDGYVGGRLFENREQRLPQAGRYREYDVNPKGTGLNRGPERIVVDLHSRKGWYSPDHYRTFYPITLDTHEQTAP